MSYISERQAKQVRALQQSSGIQPKIAIVSCNPSDLPSQTYIKLKKARADELGILADVYQVTQQEAADLLKKLAKDTSVHGIILQLPLQDPTQTNQLLNLIPPTKDIDGLHPDALVTPATVGAILWLLAGYNIELKDRQILVIGQGRLVGAPLIKALQQEGFSPTSLGQESNSLELRKALQTADIIISATGQPKLISVQDLRDKQVVIDAGTTELNGKLVGDLDPEVYDSTLDIKVTPAKGGLGPLTISYLFENLLFLIDKIQS